MIGREYHGQRHLLGDSPWGCRQWDMNELLTKHTHRAPNKCLQILSTRRMKIGFYFIFFRKHSV